MKRFLTVLVLLIAVVIAASGNIYSQLINGVTYRLNGANTATTAVTPTQLIGPNSDNVASTVTDIGFTFWFAGTPYTQFSVDENGLMKLGSTVIVPEPVNNIASTTNLPKIAPYWDDLATGTNGSVGYQLTGTAPNRILRVKWNVTVPKNTAGAANAMFQAELYEATGSIHFAYGPTYPAVNNGGYSVGIGVSATDWASLTITGNTFATVAYGTTPKDNNTMAPGGASVKRYQLGTDYTAPAFPTPGTIANTFGTANRTLTSRITDLTPYNGTGVPLSGGLVPRIYYKKTTDVSFVSTAGINQTGTGIDGTWLFTVDHSLLGGVNPGDQIQYFIVAQDQSVALGQPNISSYPAGVVATDVNTITTPPGVPSVYTIGMEFNGIKTVGAGGDYPSLTLAGGLFEKINGGQLTGNLTVNIISDLAGETGLTPLNGWANGPGGPFTLTINPVGNRTIAGSGPIKLSGTLNATIDGLNDGINSLVINSQGGAITLLAGASNNTITRTTIKGNVSSGNGVILVSNSTATPCNNNTISYCTLTSYATTYFAYQGICFTGTASTGSGNIIDHNIFSNFGYAAIHKEYTSTSRFINFTISNNEIYNTIASSERNYYKGIWLESTTGTSNIFNNKIHDLLATFNTMAGTEISAINTSNTAGDVTNIYNNVIYFDATVNHPMQAWTGITVANAGTSNIYYNSIYIGGSSTNNSAARGIVKSAVGNADIRNNVTYIPRTGSVNTPFSLAGTYTQSNNYSGDPGFTSPTNLEPDINNPNSNNLDGKGLPIASIGKDIIGNLRSTSLPTFTDIGAYEFVGTPVKFIISGNTGVAGVTLSYTDITAKTATSDSSGNYSFTVSYNWSGSVTPSLTGFTFSPANKVYSNVLADQVNQDYTAIPIVFTISGNAGIANALLSWNDGSAKSVNADANGLYSFSVSYNWSGTVAPSIAGYTFTPANMNYINVLTNQTNQNYSVVATMFTISGNAGSPGVTLNYTDGTPKSVVSDGSGAYSIIVPYSWSGIVTPTLTGFTFTPSSRNYSNVLSDQTNQNYTTVANTYIIMGNTGIGSVTLTWVDGVQKTTTSTVGGDYFIGVPFNWSGTVTPSKTGYTFTPANTVYSNVNTNFINQNYTARPITFTITGNTGLGGVTLSWTDNGPLAQVIAGNKTPETAMKLSQQYFASLNNNTNEAVNNKTQNKHNTNGIIDDRQDKGIINGATLQQSVVSDSIGNYTVVVSYNWSGTLTPTLYGHAFTPASLAFTNVLANLTAQNFTGVPIVYTITGNAGVRGAVLSYTDGTPKSYTADANGNYSFTVSYNWSGIVTPSFSNFTFSPASISYTNLLKDTSNQNYSASLPAVISYWNLDEQSAGNYADANGINNGTGNPVPVTGTVGGAQEFNGSGRIDVPDHPSLDINADGSFSVEFWYKGNSIPSTLKSAVGRYMQTIGARWWVGLNNGDGKARFYMYSGGKNVSLLGAPITDGTWHHIVATRNGLKSDSRLYVDGILASSKIQAFTSGFAAAGKLNIGGLSISNDYTLSGALDEVVLYSTVLSPAEIAQHYMKGKNGVSFASVLAPVFVSVPATSAMVGKLYSYDVNADAIPAATYTLVTAPAGMNIDSLTGLIQWAPATKGDFNVTVEAHNGAVTQQNFVITVDPAVVIPAGLISYWKLDEASGNSYQDFALINNGTSTGTLTPQAGIENNSQMFDGVAKINVPANPSLDFSAASSFSAEFWYKGSSAPSTIKSAIGRNANGNRWWVGINNGDGKARFYMNGGGKSVSIMGASVTDGNWHHVAATRNGSTGVVKIYVDGILYEAKTQLFNVDFSSLSAVLNIGSLNLSSSYTLQGNLDEVALHSVELSAAEISKHYNNGLLGGGYYSNIAPSITSAPVLNGTESEPYSYDVNATGNPEPKFKLTSFPVGMTIDSLTGIIQWVPGAAGDYSVTVEAVNGVDPAAIQTFSIIVKAAPVIPATLISLWKLDEISGPVYNDFAKVNNGTSGSVPTPAAGRVNGAQSFNGSNKIDVAANSSFNFGIGTSFSIEFLYKNSSAPSAVQVVVGRYIPAIGRWWAGVNNSDGKARFYMNGGGKSISLLGSSITDGSWHHVAVTRNGVTGETKIFVDGILGETKTQLFTVDFSSASAGLNIGWFSIASSYSLVGTLDELALHNVELTPTEVEQHYTYGLSGLNYWGLSGLAKASANSEIFNDISVKATSNNILVAWKSNKVLDGEFEVEKLESNADWMKVANISSNGMKEFEYYDNAGSANSQISYRVKFLSKSGGYAYSKTSNVELLPQEYKLEQNYPNPFNPTTNIKYELPYDSRINVTVFNTIGEKVDELLNDIQQAGSYIRQWNAVGYASGIYFLRIEASDLNSNKSFVKTLKMILLK